MCNSLFFGDFMLHEFEQSHNIAEAIENICRIKREGAVDCITVIRCFKKFRSCCKTLNGWVRSGSPRTMDCDVMLQPIEANSTSSNYIIIFLKSFICVQIICVRYEYMISENHIQKRKQKLLEHDTKVWTQLQTSRDDIILNDFLCR